MQYIKFKKIMGPFTVFSLADIRQADSAFDRRRLNEWQSKGYIRKVVKGYYVFSDLPLDEKVVFEVANRIYAPSYISFEMALAYYGFIPESIYGITSASTRKTMSFKTPLGKFTYRTIRPRLYFGFEYLKANGCYFKIASAEKALLDYLYLNPKINDAESFASLRFNIDQVMKTVSRKKMAKYAAAFGQKAMKKRITAFWGYIENA